MKRFIGILVVITAALSVVLFFELRDQRLAAEGPAGGSATIEGIEVAITSRLSARILEIHVQEGDAVQAGQVLVELDCREQEAMLLEAEAAVAAASAGLESAEAQIAMAEEGVDAAARETTASEASVSATRAQRSSLEAQRDAARRAVERLESLQRSGGATEQELDDARTQESVLEEQIDALNANVRATRAQSDAVASGEEVATVQVRLATSQRDAAQAEREAAEATRNRLQTIVEECVLEAPRAGYVQTRAYEPGELAGPGSRILTLVDTRQVTAIFYLPNAELDAARPGLAVELTADAYPERTFTGAISHVATSAEFTPRNVQTRADRDRLVYAVELTIDNPDNALRPGMPVDVSLPGTERGATAAAETEAVR